MRILHWHVHGSWSTAFVQGPHTYLVPVTPDRGPDGLGRARTWDWPDNVVEVTPEELATEEVGGRIDVVVLQRPHEYELANRWLGRKPGIDVPAIFVEHNTPVGDVPCARHVLAGQRLIPIVHVTGYNELMWDCSGARTRVIEHGVVDPGHLYTGEIERAGIVVNEPVRRGRFVGTDLVRTLAGSVPIDLFGMGVKELAAENRWLEAYEDLPQGDMHVELARRRVYLHTPRWTSLGLSLVEAMHLGMPVVAVASTDAPAAVPDRAGVLATRTVDLRDGVRRFLRDPELARATGQAARAHALRRYGLDRFLREWDELLAATVKE